MDRSSVTTATASNTATGKSARSNGRTFNNASTVGAVLNGPTGEDSGNSGFYTIVFYRSYTDAAGFAFQKCLRTSKYYSQWTRGIDEFTGALSALHRRHELQLRAKSRPCRYHSLIGGIGPGTFGSILFDCGE